MLTIWDRAKLGVNEIKEALRLRFWNMDEQSSEKRNTALHIATMAQNLYVIKYLLSKNASVKLVNKDGYTPICYALSKHGSKRNQDVIDLFCAFCGEEKIKEQD